MMPTREEMREALNQRHGKKFQDKIALAHIAICGLGGLGSHIAIALARTGIGHLHLIDFDRVDLTNLNRQNYNVHQIGLYKTEALQETLTTIAPYCEIRIDTIKITSENIAALLKQDMIICEAFDRPEAKAMLAEGVLQAFPEKYFIASSGMAGIFSANTIQTRQISSKFYVCGDEVSDSKEGIGLVAPRVMVCAAHQANMVLRIIAGEIAP